MALSQLALPELTRGNSRDVRSVFQVSDFPAYVLQQNFSRVVYSRTTIAPDGKIEKCIAEISSGEKRLDILTCNLIRRRANFSAGKWTDGSSVHGVVRVPIAWRVATAVNDDGGTLSAPDLELFVERLPSDAPASVRVALAVAADATGKIVDCAISPLTSATQEPSVRALVPVACAQAKAQITVAPPSNFNGEKVRSVQNVSVDFLVSK